MRSLSLFLSILFLSGGLVAQKRYLVSPNDEVIPLRKGQSSASIIAKRSGLATSSAAGLCGTRFQFGYTEEQYPTNTNFGAFHKDVMGEWFVAKASGKIDTIYWEIFDQVGPESTLYLRVHNSRIGPAYGPGVRSPSSPWGPPCQNWGYFVNTNDPDQGVAAFPEDAPPLTPWTSTIATPPATLPPFTNGIWGFAGIPEDIHRNSIIRVPMTDGVTDLIVTTGQKFFISMKVKGEHPVGGAPNIRTSWSAHGRTVPRTDELYPSRNWKFYEHDSGPFPTCAGINVNNVKRGWVARGGGEDTLNITVFNFWYSIVVTSNTPPAVKSTERIRTTLDETAQIFDATIEDCDAENQARAGVKVARVKWQVDDVPQADLPMINVGGDTWEATIPGRPAGSRIGYHVYAEDSVGSFDVGVPQSYRVIQVSNGYGQIDTVAPFAPKAIHATGTVIDPHQVFFAPANDPATDNKLDDGSMGPFDMGGNMPFFNDVGRYVWVAVNGAIALSKNPSDTVDVNSNGSYTFGWNFPYGTSMRRGGRSDTDFAFRMPGNFIAPLYEDLWYGDSDYVPICGKIKYRKGGYDGAPGDTCYFIVEWDSVGTFANNGASVCDELTFRVILNRCDGTIEYQYENMGTQGQDTSETLRIGLQADSTALTVPNATANKQPPYLIINEIGDPAQTRPRAGLSIKISQGTVSTALAGWNLLSVGVIPVRNNFNKVAVYPGAKSQTFAYEGVYVAKAVLANGPAYWAKYLAGQNTGARGALLHDLVVNIKAGWNMIGTIGFPVPISSIVVGGTTLTSQYWEYTGQYRSLSGPPPRPMLPGQGFWVKAAGVGTLTIHGNVPAAEPKVLPQTNYAELNSITIRDNAGRYQILYLGEEGMVKEPLSFHELPPAAPEFDARFVSHRVVETYPSRLIEKALYEYPIQIEATAYPLTISWNTVHPAERKLVLSGADGKLGNTVLDGSGSVKLTNANVNRLVVTLQNIDQPKSYALGQNYPNPFNPSTRFAVEIPKLSEVNVVVYDILGRQITTLLNGEQTAGYHTIEWDGRDARGFNVPTGIYFVRMSAGELFHDTRKIMLMK